MNLLVTHYDKLDYFGNQKVLLTSLLLDVQRKGDDQIKGLFAEALHLVDENTDDYDKNLILDFLKRVSYKFERPVILRVNAGEDFCLEVDLEPGRDFSGFNIVIRNAKTGALLSSSNKLGTTYEEAPKQSATVANLPLAPGSFAKLHLTLEHPDETGNASGIGSTLLTDCLVLVGESINEGV